MIRTCSHTCDRLRGDAEYTISDFGLVMCVTKAATPQAAAQDAAAMQ